MSARRALIVLAMILVCALGNFAIWNLLHRPTPLPLSFAEPLSSVSFAPYRRGQSPLTQVYPSLAQIEEDLRGLVGVTRAVRTYSSREGLEDVPRLAQALGLKVTQGAWLTVPQDLDGTPTFNEPEIKGLIQVANAYPDTVSRVIVGNEVLLRGELTPEQLIDYIRRVKAEVKQPVSYADVWAFFLKYPQVVEEIDFLTIHILPYWEDEPVAMDQAAQHVVDIHRRMAERFPGKPILIGEVGWPTQGRARGPAVPSRVNSASFLRELALVAQRQGFDYNWVEAFDQPWKSAQEGTVGANWGVLDERRRAKFGLAGPVPAHPDWVWWSGLAVLLGLGGAAWHLLRRGGGSLGGVLLIVAGAQLLGSLVAWQLWHAWDTSYSLPQELWAIARGALHALYAGLLLVALAALARRETMPAPAAHLARGLTALYALAAVYLTWMLLLDGRYRDIPVLEFLAPCLGLLGYAQARLIRLRVVGLAPALALDRLFPGGQPLAADVARGAGLMLLVTALVGPLAEAWALGQGQDFLNLYPTWGERLPLLARAPWSNPEMLTWATMLVGMALPFLAQARLATRARAQAQDSGSRG